MATGNLILGTARKKLGDVVMSRTNGQQTARVRVRTIANPKTEAQALQRVYFAPVSRFYAPLAGVLETSWEGLDRSSSHTAFVSSGINKAKKNGWYLPKGESFFPLPYQLSNGILPPLSYTMSANGCALTLSTTFTADSTIADLTAALIAAYALQEGDQITAVCVVQVGSTYRPAWCRFILSSSSSVKLTEISSAVPFAISGGSVAINGSGVVAGAFIASRYERGKWLRSSQSLAVLPALISSISSVDARAAAIASYRDGAGIVSSDVFLNGSTGGSVSPTNIDGFVLNYFDGTMSPDAPVLLPIAMTAVKMKIEGNYNCVYGYRLSDGMLVCAKVKAPAISGGAYLSSQNQFVSSGGVDHFPYVVWTASDIALKNWLIANGIPSSVFE